MKNGTFNELKNTHRNSHLLVFLCVMVLMIVLFLLFPEFFSSGSSYTRNDEISKPIKQETKPVIVQKLDTVLYDKKMEELANNPPPKPPVSKITKDPKTGKEITTIIEPKPVIHLWPVKAVYPNAGAILPFNRVVAYYGNLYSTKMGILGEYEEKEMLAKLDTEIKKWTVADPGTPAIPALHYIAVVAQGSPGADGKYRYRMPDSEIEKVLAMAKKINGIVFLDIQVGFSTIQAELPLFEKYLKLPNVHLGMDPEFSMKTGIRPGKVVGTYDASDINFAANYLAKIAKENNLSPKILIVHRYTQKMVTNFQEIKPLPEVQIVMNMDGWGGKSKKLNTYQQFIYPEPVLFTGFKLFYKNDVIGPGTTLMTPEDLLKLSPRPIYIQYQ